ncbi:MAG: hypothetical protein MN733_20000, partial [Nitrososphaera sp.]|nr:hypothetical protein [Nitrososphaera sp.]
MRRWYLSAGVLAGVLLGLLIFAYPFGQWPSTSRPQYSTIELTIVDEATGEPVTATIRIRRET